MKASKVTFGFLVSVSFADTNGVTTVYYPITMEKDVAVPDDGKAKLMLIKP
jgi:hypothetical protein